MCVSALRARKLTLMWKSLLVCVLPSDAPLMFNAELWSLYLFSWEHTVLHDRLRKSEYQTERWTSSGTELYSFTDYPLISIPCLFNHQSHPNNQWAVLSDKLTLPILGTHKLPLMISSTKSSYLCWMKNLQRKPQITSIQTSLSELSSCI